jgi:hypothetical protein
MPLPSTRTTVRRCLNVGADEVDVIVLAPHQQLHVLKQQLGWLDPSSPTEPCRDALGEVKEIAWVEPTLDFDETF